jgi:phage replication-related protein YjqB (UPF0714/DUF867 family)
MNRLPTLGILLLALSAFAADRYASFTSLAASEKEGTDYQIIISDMASPVTIMAIHGGHIERGTSELLNAMSPNFNKYAFEGIKKTQNFDLHITSAKFDEPRAIDLASRSKDCLSLHGYIGKKEARPTFCLGGQNEVLASKIAQSLQVLGDDFDILFPCDAYPGKHENNIVNRCENAGVQIEMNSALRDALIQDSTLLNTVAEILNQSMIN